MADHVFLIDGSNIAHANHNANPLTANGMQVQAIFGFIRSLRAMLETAPAGTLPIVLWDGRAQFRFDLYPDYKGNRDPGDLKAEQHRQAYQKQVPFIRKSMEFLGVAQALHPEREADDIAAHLSDAYASLGKRVTLVSGDKDWIQLVKPGVTWLDPIRDRKVHDDTLFDMTGFSSTQAYVEGKALQGDSSDHIPGVGGIGEKGAPLLLAQYGTIRNLFAAVDAGQAMKLGKAVLNLTTPDGRAKFERNMKLMDLRAGPRIKGSDIQVTKKSPNPEAFQHLCERLMFASILRQMPQTLRAFGVKTVAAPAVSEPPPWEDQLAA